MALQEGTSVQTKFFTGNSAISWQSLRTNFGGPGGSTDPIKFSDYYRNTSITETNPVVPDATENANVEDTSGSALSAATFRNTIDQYIVTVPSGETYTNFDVDARDWNSNLAKNVPKQFRVEGVLSSASTGTSASDAALHFNAAARNFSIRVSGQILGGSGTAGSANCGNGGRGGDAVFFNNTASNSNTSGRGTIVIESNSNAIIWAGGGGGGAGNAGNSGPALSCNFTTSNNIAVYRGGSTNPGRGCNHGNCSNTSSSSGVTGNLYASNCYGIGGSRGRCRRRQDRGQQCVGAYNKTCYYSHNYSLAGGPGGNGGNGGSGAGIKIVNPGGLYLYHNAANPNVGNPGGSNSCGNQSSTGNAGNSGAIGGQSGSSGGNSCGNGGPGGRAVYRTNGNTYSVNGGSSNKLKGST